MKCSNCNYNNDSDADFCQNCGKKLKTSNNQGFSRNTKILIIIVVILVAVVGITVGMLLKNSQQQTVNQTSKQISASEGFPVTEAPNLGYEISKSNGAVNTVTYSGVTLDQSQCIYILARAIVMINQGQGGNIPIKSVESASNPYGYMSSGSITRSQYVDIATRMYTWIDNNQQVPNFIGINTPGQADLSPQTALNLFSKVMAQYKSTGQLPASVNL